MSQPDRDHYPRTMLRPPCSLTVECTLPIIVDSRTVLRSETFRMRSTFRS
jgi:hypothetical protein